MTDFVQRYRLKAFGNAGVWHWCGNDKWHRLETGKSASLTLDEALILIREWLDKMGYLFTRIEISRY